MGTEQEESYLQMSRFQQVGRNFISMLELDARSLCVANNATMETGEVKLSVLPLPKLAFEMSRGPRLKCEFSLVPGWQLVVRFPPEDRYGSRKETAYHVQSSSDGFHILNDSNEIPHMTLLEEACRALLNFQDIIYV